jgi:hypothetical protein
VYCIYAMWAHVLFYAMVRAQLSHSGFWNIFSSRLAAQCFNCAELILTVASRFSWFHSKIFINSQYVLKTTDYLIFWSCTTFFPDSLKYKMNVGFTLCLSSTASDFGGLGIACWPLVPKFARSNQAEVVGFLRAKKSSARLPSERK